MELDPAIRGQVLSAVPGLHAFAISLCGNIDRAEDLVQETLLRALTHIDSFEPGTNMPAWLITILRNQFRDEYRKRQREVEDTDGRYAETLISYPEQTGRVEFEELRAALATLPAEQRTALILVGASDFSCDEAAAICGCPAGTIKSRVHRGRTRLAKLLASDGVGNCGRGHPAAVGNATARSAHINPDGAAPDVSRGPRSDLLVRYFDPPRRHRGPHEEHSNTRRHEQIFKPN